MDFFVIVPPYSRNASSVQIFSLCLARQKPYGRYYEYIYLVLRDDFLGMQKLSKLDYLYYHYHIFVIVLYTTLC